MVRELNMFNRVTAMRTMIWEILSDFVAPLITTIILLAGIAALGYGMYHSCPSPHCPEDHYLTSVVTGERRHCIGSTSSRCNIIRFHNQNPESFGVYR